MRRHAVERAGVEMRLPENLLPEARGALASCIEGGTVDVRCAEVILSECVTDAGEIADACLRDGRPGENSPGEPGGRTPALMSRASWGTGLSSWRQQVGCWHSRTSESPGALGIRARPSSDG